MEMPVLIEHELKYDFPIVQMNLNVDKILADRYILIRRIEPILHSLPFQLHVRDDLHRGAIAHCGINNGGVRKMKMKREIEKYDAFSSSKRKFQDRLDDYFVLWIKHFQNNARENKILLMHSK